jgi:sugar lactone lactonase YvrE
MFRPGALSIFAGSGESDYTGDNGPAKEASFRNPGGVAVGASCLYIADTGNNVVRRVDMAGGSIVTFAGTGEQSYYGDGGNAVDAAFNTPTSVAADAIGNVYVADSGNNVIRKIDSNGVISTFAGNVSGTISPESTDVVGDGSVATLSILWAPTAIALDNAGNLYIADTYNNRIRRVDAVTEIITTIAGSGVAGYSGDGSAATAAQLIMPVSIAINVTGDIAVADASNVVRIIDHDTQIISTIAGGGSNPGSDSLGDGEAATGATLESPAGLAFDATGHVLFVSDSMDSLVREIDIASGGVISVVAGIDPSRWVIIGSSGAPSSTSSPLDTALSVPLGIAVDAMGNLYIADSGNELIRQLTFASSSVVLYGGAGSVELFNNGPTTLSITTDVSGPNSDAFFPQSLSCIQLTAGSSCTIPVVLQSQEVGWLSAVLTVTADGLPYTVDLTGLSVGNAGVQADASTLMFGSISIGTATVDNVVLSNNLSSSADLSVALDGSNEFTLQNGCPTTLGSGVSCDVSVTFDPTTPGNASGDLTITGDAVTPLEIPVSGLGLGKPQLSTSPSLLSLNESVGNISKQAVTVTNNGTADATVSVTMTGDTSSWSVAANGCSTTLHVGTSCRLLVGFAPATLGIHTAVLTMSTSGQSLSVPLNGNGVRRALRLQPQSLTTRHAM